MVTKATILGAIGCEPYPDPTTGVDATLVTFILCVADTGSSPQSVQMSVLVLPTDSSATIRQKMIDLAKAKTLSEFGLVVKNEDIIVPSFSTGASTTASETRTDTFTTPGSGVIIDTSLRPLSVFAIAVEGVGGTPVSWDVRLEGSLDGSKWTKILQHTHITAETESIYSGSNRNPCLFIRSNCVDLSLGLATAIKVTILGVP